MQVHPLTFPLLIAIVLVAATSWAEEPAEIGEQDLLGDWEMTTKFDNEIPTEVSVETVVRYGKGGKAQVTTSLKGMGVGRTSSTKGTWKIIAKDAKKQMMIVEALEVGTEKAVAQQMLLKKLSSDQFQIVSNGGKVTIPTDEEAEVQERILKSAGVRMFLTRVKSSK